MPNARKSLVVPTATKDLVVASEQSVQSRAQDTLPVYGGLAGVLHYLAAGSTHIAPWWSPQRDRDLDQFWKNSDEIAGVLALLSAKVATVPVQVQPRDTRLKRNTEDAETFNVLINEEADFGQGWVQMLSRWLLDYWTCDNGAFMEIVGPGDPDGPIEGAPTGIAHLDAHRIQRTGHQEYPALYRRPDGTHVRLHRTRIVMAADMPSPREEMYGVGFCALSRAIRHGQQLLDIAIYKEEKLGSRPKRGIVVGKQVSTDVILDAMAIADEAMDSRNLSIYSQLAVLGNLPADADVSVLDLIGLPDGFDEDTSVRLGMFSLALAFGVPIRWIWPASVSGATKADAMYQHIAGLGGGVGRILSLLTTALGGDPRGSKHGTGKFLPPHLKLVFDFQDDEQDEQRANIAGKRATITKTQLESGVYDMRTAREYALSEGDLTQAQFDRLELEDGRLPDGAPVLGLFHIDKEPFLSWLDLGVDSPLSISNNDAFTLLSEIDRAAVNVQDVVANTSHVSTKAKAEQALAALNALKALYAPLAQQSVQRDLMSRFGMGDNPGAAPLPAADTVAPDVADVAPETAPATAETSPDTGLTTAAKSFNYGVSAGEIIGGQLARGVGGRFINIADLRQQLSAALLQRMGNIAQPPAYNSAATKRAANRAAISGALGFDINTLSGMIDGSSTYEQMQTLVQRGLAELNADGSITMTAAGRRVLAAANSGDVDAARAAMAKAAAALAPKGGGGKGGAKSPEERRREREEAQQKLRAENHQRVSAELGGRLNQAAFDALIQFSAGNELEAAVEQELAQAGLIEIDAEGNARMTSAGSRLVNAANRGDARAAKDALSSGADVVRKLLERANKVEATASDYEGNAEVVRQQGEQRATQLAAAATQLEANRANALAPYTQYADALDRRADQVTASGAEMAQRIAEAATQLAAWQAQLGQPGLTPTQRERLEAQIANQQRQIETWQGNYQTLLDQADGYRQQGLTLRQQARDLDAAITARVQEYLSGVDEVRRQAATAANEWLTRAEQLRAQARQWRNSVGNAAPPAVPPIKALKAFFSRRANPVPTDKDLDAAIAEWDATMPEAAQGLLRAQVIEPRQRRS